MFKYISQRANTVCVYALYTIYTYYSKYMYTNINNTLYSVQYRSILLKGQCHEIFCFRFFSWITFPQAPDNNIRIISNFFESSRRYSQVKVHHRCQRHRWQICHRFQRHRRQILPPDPLVLLTPVENLPPVSTILAANLPPVSTTPVANCHGIIDTGGKFATGVGNNIRLLKCWYLKVNLKAKIYIYVSKTTQRWPNKIIKIFLIEDFFHLPPVSLTPVANLELRISPWIFEKIRNGLTGILWGWGETDSWKEPDAKNLVTLSLLGTSIVWDCPSTISKT